MANKKYYGGENQIAYLPFKTIDALQQLGITLEKAPGTGRSQQYFINSERLGDYFINNIPGNVPLILTSTSNLSLEKGDIANISKLPKGDKTMFIWKSSDYEYAICSSLYWTDNTQKNITFDAITIAFRRSSNKLLISYKRFDSTSGKDKNGEKLYEFPETKYRHNIKAKSGNDVFFLVREMPTKNPITSGYGLENGWDLKATTTQCTGYNTTAGKTIVAFNYKPFGTFNLTYSDGTESEVAALSEITSTDITDVVSEY